MGEKNLHFSPLLGFKFAECVCGSLFFLCSHPIHISLPDYSHPRSLIYTKYTIFFLHSRRKLFHFHKVHGVSFLECERREQSNIGQHQLLSNTQQLSSGGGGGKLGEKIEHSTQKLNILINFSIYQRKCVLRMTKYNDISAVK